MTPTDTQQRRYRIAEVADLTGFTTSALRYYEQAGVLDPPERTDAGYRMYGERDVERLRLIARAKDLGCTLDEIAELVTAWDDDECGPVKHRLRSLVNTKIHEVQQHLAEQAAFAAQLQATAAMLADRPLDGPCDDTCGCTNAVEQSDQDSDPADGCGPECGCASPDPVVLGLSTDADSPPIACSLSGAEMQAGVEAWQVVLAQVTVRQPLTGGIRLVFGADAPLGEIIRLAEAEHECCPFFGFTITVDSRGTALEVTAPADGQDLIATVFGVAS